MKSKKYVVVILTLIMLFLFTLGSSATIYKPMHLDTRITPIVQSRLNHYNLKNYAIYKKMYTNMYYDYLPSEYIIEIFLFDNVVSIENSRIKSNKGYLVSYDLATDQIIYETPMNDSNNILHMNYYLFSNRPIDGTAYYTIDMGRYIANPYYLGINESLPIPPNKSYQNIFDSGYDEGYGDGYEKGLLVGYSQTDAENAAVGFFGNILGTVGSFLIYLGTEINIFGLSILDVILMLASILCVVVLLKFIL